jgi:hypothetical protein
VDVEVASLTKERRGEERRAVAVAVAVAVRKGRWNGNGNEQEEENGKFSPLLHAKIISRIFLVG